MNNISTTIKKELRGIVRDKKTLLIMLLTPLLIPVFVFIMSYIYDEIRNDTTEYNVGVNYSLSDIEKQIINEYDFKTTYYENNEELKKAYDDGIINSYVIRENDNYIIYANMNNQESYYSSSLFSMYLDSYNTYQAQSYLESIDADINQVYHNLDYTIEELPGKNDMLNYVISFGFIFSIMAITLVATYCATDSTAGEKERGTLETFLTFPIKSNEIIIGKYLSIVISCIITSIISTILVVTSLGIAHNIFDIYNDTVFNFNFITISMGLIIMITYSIFISGICIAIASMSKSYKEAQSSLTPISMLTMVPMFLDFLNIEMNTILSMIPILNHVMLLETVFCDNLSTENILNISIMFITTIVYSIIIIKYISRQYKSEKILFSI